MKKIRIAQIGTSENSHGNQIFVSLKKQSDIFEIVGYAFPENEREKFPEKASEFEGYRELTVEEILSDPTIDAVAVETEEIYLTKYALAAAKAKKHVHIEKPGSQNPDSFKELIETVKKNGTVLHFGYMYRYNPTIINLLERIEKGELGEILYVEADMSCHHTEKTREWLSTFKGGMLYFLGCHLIDLVYRVMGAPNEVIPLSCSSHLDGVSSEDIGLAALKYDNGVSLVKTSAIEKGGYFRRSLTITGSEKVIKITPLEFFVENKKDICSTIYEFPLSDWDHPGFKSVSDGFDRYDAMMASFASYVRGEKENPYTLDYELGLFEIIMKACGIN